MTAHHHRTGDGALRPSLVSWNITRRCNLTCAHCYRDARATAHPWELDIYRGMDLISDIARVGFRVLILSGGEPLLHPGLYRFVEHARAQGLRPVLGTNGTLITAEVAARLKESGLARAGISLDSADRDYHNQLRGSPTAWQRAIAGMEACREQGLPFQINTTVTRQNEEQVLEITALARKLGAAAHHVFFLVPTGRGRDIAGDVLQAQRCDRLLERLLLTQQETGIEIKPTCAPQFVRIAAELGLESRFDSGCLAGRTYCVITPCGEVQPCPYLPVAAGNVHRQPFSQIWEQAEVLRRLRTEPLGGACGDCAWGQRCFGCRARAYHASGDYMGEDPWCLRRKGACAVGETSHEQQ